LLATLAALGLGGPVILAPPAAAAGLPPAVTDCDLHARLTRHYTVAELRAALNGIPAEISEYSNCHDLIQHQLLVQLGKLPPGDGGAGGGGGSFLPTWLIVVLAVLLLAGAGFGGLALRQRRES
jgi:hypothetical protein